MRTRIVPNVGDYFHRLPSKSRGETEPVLREVMEIEIPGRGVRLCDLIPWSDGAASGHYYGRSTWVLPETLGQPSKYARAEEPKAAPKPVAHVDVTDRDLLLSALTKIDALAAEVRALRGSQLSFWADGVALS